jgi:predicted transcriptional regulator
MGNGLKVASVSFTSNGSKVTPLLYKSNLPTNVFNGAVGA